MTPAEAQKLILDTYLSANGREPLPAAEAEAMIKSVNRKTDIAKAGIYVLGLLIYLTGGGFAGSLLGFDFFRSGVAVVVLRVILLFNLQVETKGLQVMLVQKMMKSALEKARLARSNNKDIKS